MRIPSCLQRLSGNRSADREGEGCTGDTDIFLTSKGTYGRFFDAASMQTSSVLHHDGSLVETKGREGGGKGFYATKARINFQRARVSFKTALQYARTFRALRAAVAGVEGRKRFPKSIGRGRNSLGRKMGKGPR